MIIYHHVINLPYSIQVERRLCVLGRDRRLVTRHSRQCWHWHRVVRVGWSLQTYLRWGRVLMRVLHGFMRCGKGGPCTSQGGPRPRERIPREGTHRHSWPYSYEVSWREGIRIHRRGRLHSCGLHETAAAQVGGRRCL